MTIDEMIAVLEAAKTEKAEWKVKSSDRWSPFALDSLQRYGINPNEFDYRVKREPRQWWVNVYDGEPNGYIHTTKAKAEYWQSQAGTRKECVKVREVLE
jgi:hypothetical protein